MHIQQLNKKSKKGKTRKVYFFLAHYHDIFMDFINCMPWSSFLAHFQDKFIDSINYNYMSWCHIMVTLLHLPCLEKLAMFAMPVLRYLSILGFLAWFEILECCRLKLEQLSSADLLKQGSKCLLSVTETSFRRVKTNNGYWTLTKLIN